MESKMHPDFLLDNSIDNDTKAFLLPLDCLQNTSFLRKYSLRHDFISPNSWTSYIFLAIGIIMYCLTLYFSADLIYQNNKILETVMGQMKDLSLFSLFALNVILFITNVINTDNNVKVILKLQSAKRAIRFSKKSFRRLTCFNWIRLGLFLLNMIIIQVLVICGIGISWFIYTLLTHYNFMFLIITQIYIVGIKELLRALMKKWIVEMKMCIKNSEIPTAVNNLESRWRWKMLYKSYCDIIVSFDALKKASAVTTTLFTLACFLMVLGSLQGLIEFEKLVLADSAYIYTSWVSKYTTFTFALKYYFLACYLSIECENLSMAVDSVNVECLMALKLQSKSVDQKRVLKNVLRVNRHHFAKVNPFSLFTVDGTFPLKLGSFCTTYAVVLLQFQIL